MISNLKIFLILLTILLITACDKTNHKPDSKLLVIKDDLGMDLSLEQVPDKIISLAPSLTEMIYELELEDRLVGNTLYCNYPERAKAVEKIGDLLTVDYEKVLTLVPELAFVSVEGNTKEMREKLEQLGVKVYSSNPRNFSGMKNTCSQLAEIFNVPERAEKIIRQWNFEIDSVKALWKNNRPGRALFLVSVHPLMVAGANTFLNEIMELCGLENLAAQAPGNYPVYSREEILSANPEFILISKHSGITLEEVLQVYPEWKNLDSFNKNRMILLDADLFSRPGPRIVEAVKTLYFNLNKTK